MPILTVSCRLLATLSACLIAGSAAAQTPAFDPKSLRAGMAGPPTEVMVLGVMHLANLSEFDPGTLEPVMDRLLGWKPDIIAIEAVSGQDCDAIRRFPSRHPGVADQYCPSTDAARLATGLDVPAATAEIDRLSKDWPADPTPAQRRRLASVFLAGGERASAVVQWLQLPPDERIAEDGLDDALVALLNVQMARQNESEQMAAVLAARLGLARVHATDDHSADSVAVGFGPEVGEAIQAVWALPNPTLVEMQAQDISSPEGMLATFRFNNRPATQIGQAQAEMGGALAHPGMAARPYVAWWEVRNLRMAANIRATFAARPGQRVLVFVGSSHKAYFDAYLDQISEVELVDPLSILN